MDEKRIDHLETMVNRLARRARKKKSAMFTPYPISACLVGEIEGEVLRYLFCAKGTITRCMIVLNKKPKSGIKLDINVSGEILGGSVSFNADKRLSVFSPNFDVLAGDKLIVTAKKDDPEEHVTELWVGFLWIPTVKDVHVKNFLIDELENDQD